jgi:hypothetical protein
LGFACFGTFSIVAKTLLPANVSLIAFSMHLAKKQQKCKPLPVLSDSQADDFR